MFNDAKKFGLGIAAVVLLSIVGLPAFASEGSGTDEFSGILTLLGVVIVAYLVAHNASEWIARRWGIVTGVEYIVIGAIIGPGFGALDAELVGQMSPALVLGQGSLGLMIGVLMNFRTQKMNRRALAIGFISGVATFAFVGGLPMAVIFYVFGYNAFVTYLPFLICIAAIAMVADPLPISSLVRFLEAKGEGAMLVQSTARATSAFAVIAFGVIFCLFKPASALLPALSYSAPESFLFWLGIHLGLGLVLGAIFTLFLMRDYSVEKILTVVIGMVIFTSGLAYYLKVSPIFVCFVLGVVLAKFAPQTVKVESMLVSIERPLYIILLGFAGLNLSFAVPWWSYFIVVPYIALRTAGRVAGGALAARLTDVSDQYPIMGRVLWAPGALSAAMVINFSEIYAGDVIADAVYMGMVIAILVTEPFAHRYARTWLIDATDVTIAKGDT